MGRIIRDVMGSGVKTNIGVADGEDIKAGVFLKLSGGYALEATLDSFVIGYSVQKSNEDPDFPDTASGYRNIEFVASAIIVCDRQPDVRVDDIGTIVFCYDEYSVTGLPSGSTGSHPLGLLIGIDENGQAVVDTRIKVLA